MKLLSTIRSKLIFMALFLVLLPSIIFTWNSYKSTNSTFKANVEETLKTTKYAYENAIEGLKNKGLNYGEFFRNDNSIAEAISYALMTDDNSNLLDILKKYYKSLDLSNIEFTSKDGIVLARGHKPEKFNDSKLKFPFTNKMITDQKKRWDYEIGKRGVTLKFGVPIFIEEEFKGFLGYGYYIDKNFLDSVKKVSNAELVFIQKKDEKFIATTRKELSQENINQTFLKRSLDGQEEAEFEREITGVSYSSLYLPILNAEKNVFGAVWVLKDITRELGTRSANLTFSAILTLAAVFLGLISGFFILRSISGPLNRNISRLREGGEQVASGSRQISSASQSLAEGSSEQAASIEETSSSLEEMSSMTKQNADNAHQADNLMKEANQVVGRANDSMGELTSSMKEISKASEETSKIIKTIDEIAFQTNLLALNAAVEAARAGEAGAGFAVVADEVRNLAMRAADAARNTADLIEGTVKKVKEGGDLVAATNDAFIEVAESASKVGELVGEIAAASNEQAEGIEQVNKAVVEMDKVVQHNAANAEESASASEEMNAQAEQMKSIVDDLVLLAGGSAKKVAQDTAAKDKQQTKAVSKKIAKPATKEIAIRPREVKPEQVIPMDDEFREF